MNQVANDILMHYGVGAKDGAPGRGSGRYPLGSGLNPFQHGADDLLSRYDKMKKSGMTDAEIAAEMGILNPKTGKPSSGRLRVQVSLATNARRALKVEQAEQLRAEGKGYTEIGRIMGISDNSVRSLLNEQSKQNTLEGMATAEYLKEIIDKTGKALDVGEGVEEELGTTKTKLDKALYILELNGYNVYGRGQKQATNPSQQTNLKLIAPPDMTYHDAYNNENVTSVHDYTDSILINNGTEIRKGFEYPSSLDSKRLKVRYAEDGGEAKDGLIELRRGVDDLSLGESNYAQVRILVDGTHYLKGMAAYSDNMPDGVDVIFNTNKKKGTPALGPKDNTVLKPIGKDPENPFNSNIKEVGGQSYYTDPKGKYTNPITGEKESLSLINKRADEGDWKDWSDTLPAQFLSKQSIKLIDQQLKLSENVKESELKEILEINNNTVKKKLLHDFAGKCDSDAVHLKAAALPRQKYQVILPLESIKETEVYAPNYRDGETVALIRYPHASINEIPILKVNNKNPEGKRVITPDAADAIGISKSVADRLSGADFDGDTVQVIPISEYSNVRNAPQMEALKGFDPHVQYGRKPGDTFKRMGKQGTQTQMGIITNLISDMSLLGADDDEKAKAIKHSMVVIDAEKHDLDYKRSERENDIAALKKKWQIHLDENGEIKYGGASTIVSRAKATQRVVKRKGGPRYNEDGSIWYKEDPKAYHETTRIVYEKDPVTGRYRKDENGKKIPVLNPTTGKPVREKTGKWAYTTQESTQMAETNDARTLVSEYRTKEELRYADYANKMKSLANQARKEEMSTPTHPYSKKAAELYKPEVDHLNEQLRVAKLKKPRARQAERIAAIEVDKKIAADPELYNDKKALKKVRQQAITKARAQVGIAKYSIDVSPREWEAIQAGAIHDATLTEILKYADMDKIREYATPRRKTVLSTGKINIMKSMKANGYTNEQIANRLGVSVSTIQNALQS